MWSEKPTTKRAASGKCKPPVLAAAELSPKSIRPTPQSWVALISPPACKPRSKTSKTLLVLKASCRLQASTPSAAPMTIAAAQNTRKRLLPLMAKWARPKSMLTPAICKANFIAIGFMSPIVLMPPSHSALMKAGQPMRPCVGKWVVT